MSIPKEYYIHPLQLDNPVFIMGNPPPERFCTPRKLYFGICVFGLFITIIIFIVIKTV